MSILTTKFNWRDLRAAIKRLRKRLQSPAKHTLKGSAEARRFLGKWIDSGGNGKWAQLKSYTLERRKKRWGYYRRYSGSGSRPLRWSRGIRDSFAKRSATGHVERVSGKNTIIFGSNYTINDAGRKVQVVRIHHWGRGRNPQRKLMPTGELGRFFKASARAMAQLQEGFTRFK